MAGTPPQEHRRLRRAALCGGRQGGARARSSAARSPTATSGAWSTDAYASFRHPAVCPLAQLHDNLFVLELFHGPTLAFKDVAMQLLGAADGPRPQGPRRRARRSSARPLATPAARPSRRSGVSIRSTSSSSIRTAASRDVQRRQMTTVDAPNVHALAVEGTFDDCQNDGEGDVQPRALPRRVAAFRRQLDQLGARRGAGGLLLHRRSRPRRAAPARFFLGADRQFRRHPRRLRGEADGACRSSG